MANPRASGIIPAQLGFLAIYNPSLGTTDETIEDQIVYYASAASLSTSKRRRNRNRDGRPTDSISQEERNERLRQIGLAQGMVEFARSFSGGTAVDSIDTERTRVVLHELEPGWWLLVSIDLTRLPLPPTKKTAPTSPISAPSPPPPSSSPSPQARSTTASPAPTSHPEPQYEYSSRDLKPPLLLLQDLLRAHALFLLHHGASLASLFAPSPAPSPSTATTSSATPFTLLARYWDAFLPTWHVLLHGNPACAVLGGIKVAASGELGMGVGEEERGSGEREVLEGLVGGVDGLVDLVVGRYGSVGGGHEEEGGKGRGAKEEEEEGSVGRGGAWLGLGSEVGAEDGVVFLGAGAVSRGSLRAVVAWMEDIYAWGENTYGVADAARGAKARTKRRRGAGKQAGASRAEPADGKRKDQAKVKNGTDRQASNGGAEAERNAQPGSASAAAASVESGGSGGMDKMFSYLTLGYGTYWSLGGSSPAADSSADEQTPEPTDTAGDPAQKAPRDANDGCFLVGLAENDTEATQPEAPKQPSPARPQTVVVELQPSDTAPADASPDAGTPGNKPTTATLRPVVYVHRPFVYILLFREDAPPTPWEELAQSLRVQLAALHKPLLTSTAYRPEKPDLGHASQSTKSEIYDLVFDTRTLTIHSTIPNIPDPFLTANPSAVSNSNSNSGGGILASLASPPKPSPLSHHHQREASAAWTPGEALSTHTQILHTFAGTRADSAAMERTCKTSRGWWVVWSRVAGPAGGGADAAGTRASSTSRMSDAGDGEGSGEEEYEEEDGAQRAAGKEIFLVRRASDHGGGAGLRRVSASYVGGGGGGSGVGGRWTDGAGRLAQGIGVDTRRYIEGLLSLNR